MTPQAKTRTGQKVLQYLKDHPDETSPTRIAKETGCDRNTARTYLRDWQKQRGVSASGAAPNPAAAPPVKAVEPAAESATPRASGRSFDDDFPRRKPARPDPTPAPPPPPSPVPDDEPEAASEADDDGPLGWLL